MTKLKLMLQLFAEPNTQTTVSSGLSAEMKVYYEKELLRNAKPNLVHSQFSKKHKIPKGNGKKVEFRRFGAIEYPVDENGNPRTLVEGVTPDGNKLQVVPVEAEVSQYGDFVTLSDLLELTAIDNNVLEATDALSSSASLVYDKLTRDQLNAGTNIVYAGGVESRNAVAEKLTITEIYKAVNVLKRNNAPKIDGDYVCILHPDVSTDIQLDPNWRQTHEYAKPEELFEGEIGKIGGCRFVESTNAKIWKKSDVAGGKAVYSSLVLGKDAYGEIELEGGGLQHFVKQLGSAGSADPLNQRSTVGYKFTHTAKILDETRLVRIESLSDMSDKAVAN